MWQSLGFRDSPYDARPLGTVAEDVDLLVGRASEAVSFCTILDSASEGVFVLSGPPGVGKTSFINVQQYLLSNDKSPFGPRVLPSYQLCQIFQEDKTRDVALRILSALLSSIETHCTKLNITVPNETKKISTWAKTGGSGGFGIGIQIAGFGVNIARNTSLPPIADCSFEAIRDAVVCLTSETIRDLNVDCVLIALDNIENLSDDALKSILFAFRDTLFMIPGVWWVLIGQSGLGSLIQALDPRIADRLSGSAIEMDRLSFDELQEAISKRVARFNIDTGSESKSPLPESIHRELYSASNGEVRFVFKYSAAICTRFVKWVRQSALSQIDEMDFAEKTAIIVATKLINDQIPEGNSRDILKSIVKEEVDGLHFSQKQKDILKRIYKKKEARSSDYKMFSIKSAQDFSRRFLSVLYKHNHLSRRQAGRAVYYSLCGTVALAVKNGLI